MSGIYGYIVNPYKKPMNRLNLERLGRWNHAYGKAFRDSLQESEYGLGFCGDQLNDRRQCEKPIIIRGEQMYLVDVLLYNPKELWQALKGEADEPADGVEKQEERERPSDQELLVDWIERFGFRGLAQVNGDFAGVVIHRENHKITLFRDHMGVRPLYYYREEGFLVFSSDMRGLLALPQVDTSVNEAWLYKLVGGYSTLDPVETEFAEIKALAPACILEIQYKKNEVRSSEAPYWRLGSQKILRGSEEEYCRELRELITDAVRRRLEAVSGIVGGELSGGLDSSVIDILIHREGREAAYFSWSYSPEELPLVEGDERRIIEEICAREGIHCEYARQQGESGEESNFSANMRELGLGTKAGEDKMFRDLLLPGINTLPICESAQYVSDRGARAIFSGHGGDEGVSHRARNYELFHHGEYLEYLRQLWWTTEGKSLRLMRTVKACIRDLRNESKRARTPFQSATAIPELMNKGLRQICSEKEMKPLAFGYDPIQYIREGGSRNRLEVTALLGAYSDVRYLFPYLDYRVVNYAVSIPRWLYLRGNTNRYLFRSAFRDIIPDSLYRHQCKEDVSMRGRSRDERTEKYRERNRLIREKLTGELWQQYLDLELAKQYLRDDLDPEDSPEIFRKGENVQRCLLMCALVENTVRRCRE